ncbi:MAG: hypothetical protein IT392_07885 [Nitrospirae bacterium]|nr:hypothetical protein [Nitrospirota bacterium]
MSIKDAPEKQISIIAIFVFIIIISNFLLCPPHASAWKFPIEVSTVSDNGEKIYNKLVIGKEQGATDDLDYLWDTPALTSHPDSDHPLILRAYLSGKAAGGKQSVQLWKDIRGFADGNTMWRISIDSVPKGKKVVLTWDIPQDMLKSGERLILKDNGSAGSDGQPQQTDISMESSYSFLSTDEGTRSMSLELSKASVRNGNGLGCGTIRSHRDGPESGGIDVLSVACLFLPIIFFKSRRFFSFRRVDMF